MAQSRPLNPFALTALIVLVMLTVVFTILVFVASNSIKASTEGSPDDPTRREPLNAIEREVTDLKDKVATLRRDIEIRDRALYDLGLDVGRYRTYYDQNQQIAGIAGEQLTYNGKSYAAKHSTWEVVRDLIAGSKQRLDSYLKEHDSAERKNIPALEDAIGRRQNELQEVVKRANERDAAFKTDQERLQKQKEELDAAKTKIEKQRRADYSQRATSIGQKEEEIRGLLELELHWLKELDADGELLEVAADHGFVVINLGKADRVFPGLKFEVFQYEKGRYLEKGMVEVIDVRPQIATCRILAERDGKRFPLARGDRIGNPVFGTKRPRVFVLEGDFKQFNKEDLASFIRATGGIVRDKLSPGVDFLVAGDRSNKFQDLAREYPLLAMTEDQLLKYVQTTFPSK